MSATKNTADIIPGTRLQADDIAKAMDELQAALSPLSDVHASADYRRRVAGALAGALFAVALLRLYRVEEGAPWPGQGGRPYPRALAALYLSVTVALAVIWLVGGVPMV